MVLKNSLTNTTVGGRILVRYTANSSDYNINSPANGVIQFTKVDTQSWIISAIFSFDGVAEQNKKNISYPGTIWYQLLNGNMSAPLIDILTKPKFNIIIFGIV